MDTTKPLMTLTVPYIRMTRQLAYTLANEMNNSRVCGEVYYYSTGRMNKISISMFGMIDSTG